MNTKVQEEDRMKPAEQRRKDGKCNIQMKKRK